MINSVGDQIESGRYFSHSSFERVVNFYPESGNYGLLAIAKPSVGSGPKTITACTELFELANSSREIRVDSDAIHFFTKTGTRSLSFTKERYNSKIQTKITSCFLDSSIEKAWNTALLLSPEKSFAFLLDPSREDQFTGAFEKALIARVKRGVDEIFENNNLIEGIKLIKGVGSGLTPSGDDFTTGLLAAATLIEYKHKTNFKNIKQVIRENALGGNPFSNTYIDLAAKGNFTEAVKKLLTALLDNESVEAKTRELIDFGHSSGADLLAGVLLGLKRRKSWLLKD